jgi:hypothetical protein
MDGVSSARLHASAQNSQERDHNSIVHLAIIDRRAVTRSMDLRYTRVTTLNEGILDGHAPVKTSRVKAPRRTFAENRKWKRIICLS